MKEGIFCQEICIKKKETKTRRRRRKFCNKCVDSQPDTRERMRGKVVGPEGYLKQLVGSFQVFQPFYSPVLPKPLSSPSLSQATEARRARHTDDLLSTSLTAASIYIYQYLKFLILFQDITGYIQILF